MKRPSKEQEKKVVQQWVRAAPELARAREEELANREYDWRIVDALLDAGVRAPRKTESSSGLIEMQRWFMLAARRQGLLPSTVREEQERDNTRDDRH